MLSKRGREGWTKSDENVNPQKFTWNHLLSVYYKRQKKKKEERQALEGELQVIQEAALG